jgi:hypothetical protein
MADSVYAPEITISGDQLLQTPGDRRPVTYKFTKGSAAAITIAAPTDVVDDGKVLVLVSGSAYSHVVTSGTDGFNGKGSSGTITFAGKGGRVILEANNGHWWTGVGTGLNGATVA